jgi:molecular chaperone DnaK (HSP70)
MKNNSGPKVTAWGYETKSSTNTFTWFKLGLGQDQAQEVYDDKLLYHGLGSIKCPDVMTYSDLAKDYLNHFYQHMMRILKEQEGDATFDLLAFHFILAVPAGWPDVSRNLIKSCAERAGFGSREGDKISLIAEPEAAALAMFHSYSSKLEAGGTFKVRNSFLPYFCDC